MLEHANTIDGTGVCSTCGVFPVAERYVQLEGRTLHVFCSRECLGAGLRDQRARRTATRFRHARRLTIGLVFAGACLTPHPWPLRKPPRPEEAPVADKAESPPLPSGWFGPEWPPTETSVLAALGRDSWVHPLAGPFRRMPRSDTRVFGAVRPGNRAWECRNGHCGVDLGGEIWGEQVRAVHDGVVDKVQRAANPEHGGRYVRIAHHGGTVFTQYFHLAAIPRGLERGVTVKGGEVIGLLGDTGVKESQPHLHFSVSIRLAEDRPEKYIDPEPLIALWPLRIPVEGSEVGLVTITGAPGVPLGSAPRLSARARNSRTGAHQKTSADTGPSEAAPAGDEEPSRESATPETNPTPDEPAANE
jgi:murein DD-endopeptidase MepM/ murein hydrolase activator NlpD